MLILYFILATLLYILIVWICKNRRSTYAIHMIYQDGKSVAHIPFEKELLSESLIESRRNHGLSLWQASQALGTSMMNIFLVEHGFKIPTDDFIYLLTKLECVQKIDDRYYVSEGCWLEDWCLNNCKEYVSMDILEQRRNARINQDISISEIIPMENVTFDDYIFRGNPMIFIFTAISVQAQDIPPEEVREEIMKG